MDGQENSVASVLFEVPGSPGTSIGKHLTLYDFEGKRAVFHRSVAIHIYDANDKAAEAACIAMLSRADLASDIDIAKAFDCHRNTVGRLAGRLLNEGMAAVVPAKRGPKGPHKVTEDVMAVIEEQGAGLGPAALSHLVAEQTGVVLSATHVKRLQRPSAVQLELVEEPEGVEDDTQAPSQVPEPAQDVFDPPAVLPVNVRGPYVGAALYYPALGALGLLDVARSLFRLPRSEIFGVRAVVSTLFFMTLLHRTTVESAKHLRRRAFGAVVGTGRAPAVKTLRRKLAELVNQGKGSELGTALARRWVESGFVASAFLYVDGHMKAYTGKRKLQEVWNPQRRMPLPAVHSYWVSDQGGRPLLFLTEELSANLAKAMPRVIEATREVVGERRFTVVFDRGGYDSKLFSWLEAQGIDFITYQRGTVRLDPGAFSRREARFEGRRVRLFLAEDEVTINRTGPWRRIVVRTKDGHQTPILTSHTEEISSARIACLMFARWRQENFFKYMDAHHGIDELVSYETAEADQTKLVANPARRALDRKITELRREASAIRAELGDAVLEEPRTGSRSAHGLKTSRRGTVKRLRDLEGEISELLGQRRSLPSRIPLSETGRTLEALRLEHKAIIDRIKVSAYNAEEWMLERLMRHYPNTHDVRDLLRAFAELPGEIRTVNNHVQVTLDSPDTPMHRRALHGLVDDLNAERVAFPGTDAPVIYRVAVHHSEAAA